MIIGCSRVCSGEWGDICHVSYLFHMLSVLGLLDSVIIGCDNTMLQGV